MTGTLLRASFAAGLVFLTLAPAFITPAWSARAERGENIILPGTGEAAPDFSLRDFKGKIFTLSELKGKKAVLLWFTNLCGGCQTKFGEMEKLRDLYEKKGAEVIAVSILGKDKKTAEEIIRKKKTTFRFLYDPEGKATKLFSGEFIPNTCPLQNIYIINRNARISYASHYPGAGEAEISGSLDKAVKGGKVK